MQIKGNVISVEIDVQVAKNGGGTYPGSRLAFRDETGAIKEKAFHQNVFKFNAPLKVQLSNLKVGEGFVAEVEKEGEFWNWKSIQPASTQQPVVESQSTASYQSPKSTYETPEERAKKQVYIVRQSSITAALSYTNQIKDFYKGTENPIEEVINIAKQFEAYVFGEEFDDGSIYTMKGDVI